MYISNSVFCFLWRLWSKWWGLPYGSKSDRSMEQENAMRKQIQGYDGLYFVDETGTIYGQKGKPLKPYDNGYGYLIVDLYGKDGTRKHKKVHRLVAETFLENPNGFFEINHIDENKHNNQLCNLEWCTSSYNKRYGTGKKSRSDGMKRVWASRRADNA